MSRTEIEHFCRGFLLYGNYYHLHKIVAEYDEQLLCSIDTELFTANNFDQTFQTICRSLFAIRPVTATYVLVVLGFAMNIDNRLKHLSWYRSDEMIISLASVLVDVKFDPKCIVAEYTFCTLF